MEPPRSQPPVALRVVRPHESEDALLAAESSAFTRTGVVLLGAPSRPNGVVLRFELCLRDGTPAMRGEGRVVGFRPPDEAGESALMLRFTKLDVKSKDLLDRAVSVREERRSHSPAPPSVRNTASPPPSSVTVAPLSMPPASQPDPTAAPTSNPTAAPASTSPSLATPAAADPEAMDVDDLDLRAADESDLTEQVPPVAPIAERPAPPPSSRADRPRADVLARALERGLERRQERGQGPFQATLDPSAREGALARLRARKPT